MTEQKQETFDTDTFNDLLEDFTETERPIIRKNASKDPEKERARLDNIVEAYNKIIRYTVPIFESGDKKLRAHIKPKLIDVRNRLIDSLEILGSNAKVPELLTEQMTNDEKNNLPNENDDNSTNMNSDKDAELENKGNPSGNDTKEKKTNNKKNNMALSTIEYYNLCTRQLNTMFSGDPIGLPPFIDAINLLQRMDTSNEHSEILKGVILTKLQGTAREILPQDPSIEQIKTILNEKIKTESSKVIMGRMMALKADRTNFGEYAKKAESLAEQFKRSLILEKIPNEKANDMTIDQTIDLCRNNTQSPIVKSVLASTKFDDAKDVIAKFIIQSRTENTDQQVMAFRQTNRYNNGNRNNAQHNNGMNSSGRGRSNYRGNNNRSYGNRNDFQRNRSGNGRGNYRPHNNWRGNSNRNGANTRVFYSENSAAPPSGATPDQTVQINQAGNQSQ